MQKVIATIDNGMARHCAWCDKLWDDRHKVWFDAGMNKKEIFKFYKDKVTSGICPPCQEKYFPEEYTKEELKVMGYAYRTEYARGLVFRKGGKDYFFAWAKGKLRLEK